MTHTSTEQERAGFEKYMLLENYFSERDLVWNGVDGYDCTDADDAFGIWLIARRVQVMKGNHVTFQAQGGEAAPVQMPTPDGYIMDSLPNGRLEYKRGPLSQMDSICNSTMPVYEYGTVRQLLAAHGIQEQST